MTGKIIGLGSYLPEKILTNDDLSKMMDTSDEWITERTGIKQRHIADPIKDRPSIMVVKAAKQAVEAAGIDPKDIELIVTASTTPDLIFPTMSTTIQEAIGASENCGCFDVNSACPGFVAAYNTVQSFIESGNVKLALVAGVECNSNFVDWTDRGTCILFGDGAGCAVLKAEEGKRNEFIMRSSGKRGTCLHCESARQPYRKDEEGFDKLTGFNMNGREVFKFAITEVPKIIIDLSVKYGFDLGEIDYFILHQANQRIIEATAKKLKQPLEKFPMNIMNTGNCSSASIPILLKEMNDKGMLARGQKIVMASFGAGLVWNANYIEY
ncbi:MAG: ketoacyl-ACP synthase III [Clostridiales bacterium]|nr:ketoacyl-ACP synthase III [Clostridiales bacterium]